MKCSEMLHILDDNLIELLQKHINVLTTALDKVSNYNLRLEESNKSFVSALQKAEAYNVQLENERDVLMAQVEVLRKMCMDDYEYHLQNTVGMLHEYVPAAVADWAKTELPNSEDCLREIRAEAIDDANDVASDLVRSRFGRDCSNFVESCLTDYANQVRQGGE